MIDEYRDGILIGRITRDFQLNVLNCPPPLDAGIDVASTCNGLSVDFVNTSGASATTFWWDFGTGDPADTSVAFAPTFIYSAPGTYTVTLIVEKGTDCADTTTYELEIMDPVSFSVVPDSVDCNGGADGGAAVTPADGSYTYAWSTLESGYSIDGLSVGTYWVEATNGIGCVDTQYFDVDQPDVLAVDFTLNEPNCFDGLDGSIEAIASGGVAPYTYEWLSPSTSGSLLTDIGAGDYSVVVTDDNGCTADFNTTLFQPTELLVSLVNVEDVSCNGGTDGSMEIGMTGGTTPYSIEWMSLPGETGTIVTDVAAGTYMVEVTDANGCQAILIITVSEPAPFTVDLYVIDEETCSASNGQVFADVTGGTGTITFDWVPDVSETDVAEGLSSGMVDVTITDAIGCQAFDEIYVPDNPTGTASVNEITPVSCAGGDDGSIVVDMEGGTSPFIYNWSCSCPDTNSVGGLTAGDYWVEVVDNNGCVDSLYFTIDELPAVEIIDTVSPLCNGGSDGSAEVLANGGTAPYNYEWSTDPVATSAMVSGLAADTYTVTVTDQNGCEASIDVPVSEPDPLVIDAHVLSNILCFGDSAGIATATAAGGTMPYTVYWPDLAVYADTVYDLPSGYYSVVVTDDHGCSDDTTVKILEYNDVVAEIVGDSVICPGEVANFIVMTNDFYGLYDYQWSVDGVYHHEGSSFSWTIDSTVTITIALYSDAGCDPIFDTLVVVPITIPPGNVTLTGTPDTICKGDAATLEAHVTDMTHITDLYWSVPEWSGFGPHIVIPDEPTVYEVTIVNVCGEEQSAFIPIHVHMPPAAEIVTGGTVGCDQVELNFAYSYEEGAYSLTGAAWDIQGEIFSGDEAMIMLHGSGTVNSTLSLTFSNGCTFDYNAETGVTVFDSPDADFYFNPDPAIQFENTEFVDISHGNPSTWEWYLEGNFVSSDERPSHVFNEVGEFEVTEIIIDGHGCSDTVSHIINVIGDFAVYVPNAFTPDGDGYNNNFKPVVNNIMEEGYEFLVFNRWGEVVFRTTSLYGSWDGTYNGEAVEDDVYVWKVTAKDNRNETHQFTGHVTVLK